MASLPLDSFDCKVKGGFMDSKLCDDLHGIISVPIHITVYMNHLQGSPQKFLKVWWHLVALSSWVVLQMLLKVLPNFK